MKTLQQIDTEITQLEQQLAVLHEQRREWVNHLDLNKRVIRDGDFSYTVTSPRQIMCRHTPTGKATCKSFNEGREMTLAKRKAQAAISAKLLAEGWVHAS